MELNYVTFRNLPARVLINCSGVAKIGALQGGILGAAMGSVLQFQSTASPHKTAQQTGTLHIFPDCRILCDFDVYIHLGVLPQSSETIVKAVGRPRRAIRIIGCIDMDNPHGLEPLRFVEQILEMG